MDLWLVFNADVQVAKNNYQATFFFSCLGWRLIKIRDLNYDKTLLKKVASARYFFLFRSINVKFKALSIKKGPDWRPGLLNYIYVTLFLFLSHNLKYGPFHAFIYP